MSDAREPLNFTERPGSSRGLRARPYLASGEIAYLANISSIDYSVVNLTDGGAAVSGSLVVANVMFAALQNPWSADLVGYTFRWLAPGSLWPLAGKQYFIDVVLTATDGFTYKISWQVTTTAR